MEDVCGVEVRDPVRALRRLLYCGEWIESHALHVFMLHAPDFLGLRERASRWRATTPRSSSGALALKKAGNALMRVVGGREIHPINVRVGGFYRAPHARRAGAGGRGARARARVRAAGRRLGPPSLPLPGLRGGLRLRRAAATPTSTRSRAGAWSRAAASTSRPTSTTSTSSRSTSSTRPRCTRACATATRYLVGPLARYALNRDALSPVAREAADAAGLERRRAATRFAASSCARWRSSTRSTRRCG